MGYSKIEIKTKGEPPSAFTEIWIDGHQIKGVRRFTLEQEVGNEIPLLTLDLNALDVSIDAFAIKQHRGFGKIEFNLDDREDSNEDNQAKQGSSGEV